MKEERAEARPKVERGGPVSKCWSLALQSIYSNIVLTCSDLDKSSMMSSPRVLSVPSMSQHVCCFVIFRSRKMRMWCALRLGNRESISSVEGSPKDGGHRDMWVCTECVC